MNVLMISPGFPVEQPFFTRGLASQGVQVIGLGDQHESALPPMAREALSAYLHVNSFTDENHVLQVVADAARRVKIDQIECTWEPYMTLAARLRQMLGIGGMTLEQTIPFRDKEVMKQMLDKAEIRTPRQIHTLGQARRGAGKALTQEQECRQFGWFLRDPSSRTKKRFGWRRAPPRLEMLSGNFTILSSRDSQIAPFQRRLPIIWSL